MHYALCIYICKTKEDFHIIKNSVSVKNIGKVLNALTYVYASFDHQGALWFDRHLNSLHFYQFTQKIEGLDVFLIPSKKESYLEENRCRFFMLTSKQ